MILGFKSRFKGKIINGQKIHTIRADVNERWKAGNVIHFATGVRTKFYNQFWYGHCKSTQKVQMYRNYGSGSHVITISIDGRWLDDEEMREFIKNDGFDDLPEFVVWFLPEPKWIFGGKIIHWTNKLY